MKPEVRAYLVPSRTRRSSFGASDSPNVDRLRPKADHSVHWQSTSPVIRPTGGTRWRAARDSCTLGAANQLLANLRSGDRSEPATSSRPATRRPKAGPTSCRKTKTADRRMKRERRKVRRGGRVQNNGRNRRGLGADPSRARHQRRRLGCHHSTLRFLRPSHTRPALAARAPEAASAS